MERQQLVIINKTLNLNKLAIDVTAPDAEKEWKFWPFQFQDFVQPTVDLEIVLLKILHLFLTASTFEYVQDCKSYDEVMAKLNEFYVKLKNVIFTSGISVQEAVNKAMALNVAKENATLYTKSEPTISSVSATDLGLFVKVCRSTSIRTASVSVTSLISSSFSPAATELKNAEINGTNITTLIDSGR
ncbi:hypothetical protein T4B_9421 [Trichinella pseudospiralis]|uniref:Uncharacterized protein n=2 Tax=Trichinella pseudospiralis TaxID=6337 RepID=A0A0V1HRE2_TRIPS|nr:hypothetical protein T4A_13297 [Trichinella pseudospiralis]KRY68574.1 hypothetical protein T4A_3950 [Trichinella pseudospiralis]KRZ12863.1 hypothetical protein T4B_13749 [Trichinella pseudospiralis]KRZ27407.1 hypothetical protein T4B_9421 [Trichinella pseudospiralis]KRZ37334.1 hypothetical protein T4C_467 [Trichinella pseudospiralis]